MPTYRSVTIKVTDIHNNPLAEYGVLKKDSKKLTSCFIQSETDKQFHIRIQPDISVMRYGPDAGPSNEEYEVDEYGRSNERRGTLRAPLHLLATLRLDGRSKYEKRAIVFLNQEELSYSSRVGEVILDTTTIHDKDGGFKECGWVFKDVGIDVSFENLQLGTGAPAPQPEEALTTAFGAMSANQNEEETKSGVGQIEVQLDRISVGETVEKRPSDLGKDVNLAQLDASAIGDSPHTIARSEVSSHRWTRRVTWYHLVNESDGPYARFVFQYCDEKKLRKMGFLDPVQASKPGGKRVRALNFVAATQALNVKTAGLNGRKAGGEEGDEEGDEEGYEEGDEVHLGTWSMDLADRIRKYTGDDKDEREKRMRAE